MRVAVSMLLTAAVLMGAIGYAVSPGVLWEAYYNKAEASRKAGQPDQAVMFYGMALNESRAAKDNEHTRKAVEAIAAVYKQQKDFPKMEKAITDGIAGLKAASEDHASTDVARLQQLLATHYQEQGKHDEALDAYRLAISNLEKASGRNHRLVPEMLTAMAGIYQKQNRPEQAAVLLEEAGLLKTRAGDEACIEDASNPLTQFTKTLHKRIKKNWHPTKMEASERAIVAFDIAIPSGEVQNIRVKQSSDHPGFDRKAIQAIKDAAPFPEIPHLCSDTQSVEFTFDYEVRRKDLATGSESGGDAFDTRYDDAVIALQKGILRILLMEAAVLF